MNAEGSDKAVAEAIVKGLELAGFDPTNMRSDDVVTFFATAFICILDELPLEDHERAALLMQRWCQKSVAKRRRRE